MICWDITALSADPVTNLLFQTLVGIQIQKNEKKFKQQTNNVSRYLLLSNKTNRFKKNYTYVKKFQSYLLVCIYIFIYIFSLLFYLVESNTTTLLLNHQIPTAILYMIASNLLTC